MVGIAPPSNRCSNRQHLRLVGSIHAVLPMIIYLEPGNGSAARPRSGIADVRYTLCSTGLPDASNLYFAVTVGSSSGGRRHNPSVAGVVGSLHPLYLAGSRSDHEG